MKDECIDCAPRKTPAAYEYEYLTVVVPLCAMHWSHWLSADDGLIDPSLPQTVVKNNIIRHVAYQGIAEIENMLKGEM